jgi:hypothetical protein
MKLFRLTLGSTEKFGVAKNEKEMYKERAEIDPTFDYTPVVIEEVKVDGFVIELRPEGEQESERLDEDDEITEENILIVEGGQFKEWVESADRDALKQFLEELDIDFDGRIGEEKLRELVLANA